jgi:pimeloyl-ACP methyl ester carboxylesterase
MIRTDRAISHEDPSVLQGLAAHGGPALVLYGEYDIFGTSNQVVRDRLPKAVQVTLAGSGHLHWLQTNRAIATSCEASTPPASIPWVLKNDIQRRRDNRWPP